jgi:hypothetical protein
MRHALSLNFNKVSNFSYPVTLFGMFFCEIIHVESHASLKIDIDHYLIDISQLSDFRLNWNRQPIDLKIIKKKCCEASHMQSG